MDSGDTGIHIHRHPDCEVWELPGCIDLTRLKAAHPARYPFLLQSVATGTPQSRHDLLLGFPSGSLILDANGIGTGAFLAELDQWWRQHRTTSPAIDGVPFRGGWALYLGYELAMEVEPALKLPRANDDLPAASAVRCPAAIIVDHERGVTSLVAEHGHQQRLDDMLADIRGGHDTSKPAGDMTPVQATIEEEEPDRYLRAVARIRRYIREGDVFQVNLSREWIASGTAAIDDASLYRRLCETNPAPFAAWYDLGDVRIFSSSPERLVACRGRDVQTRPIAGTRPRRNGDNDDAITAALLAHPKERAEHIMLIDLERNDLGRICIPGSIEVDELMVPETYAHVHHIVSNVRGQLRDDVSPGDVIRAVFPGGTITGCPKVRCMEIIAELEGQPRSAYTGSLGYLDRSGDLDLNILIRTITRHHDRLHIRAGAGIVADSDPERELQETRAKARGMLRAIGFNGD